MVGGMLVDILVGAPAEELLMEGPPLSPPKSVLRKISSTFVVTSGSSFIMILSSLWLLSLRKLWKEEPDRAGSSPSEGDGELPREAELGSWI